MSFSDTLWTQGLKLIVMTADQQRRTPRDVRGPWVRPKCISKARGRKGSRRAWKRLNPPHWLWFYREPEDVISYQLDGQRTVIVTPRQKQALMTASQAK